VVDGASPSNAVESVGGPPPLLARPSPLAGRTFVFSAPGAVDGAVAQRAGAVGPAWPENR
jgi:hypothetical protein